MRSACVKPLMDAGILSYGYVCMDVLDDDLGSPDPSRAPHLNRGQGVASDPSAYFRPAIAVRPDVASLPLCLLHHSEASAKFATDTRILPTAATTARWLPIPCDLDDECIQGPSAKSVDFNARLSWSSFAMSFFDAPTVSLQYTDLETEATYAAHVVFNANNEPLSRTRVVTADGIRTWSNQNLMRLVADNITVWREFACHLSVGLLQ